jgi:hypothetical protein
MGAITSEPPMSHPSHKSHSPHPEDADDPPPGLPPVDPDDGLGQPVAPIHPEDEDLIEPPA